MKKLFLNDKFILLLIFINSAIIFLEGFNELHQYLRVSIHIADTIVTILFVIELLVKIGYYGWYKFIRSGWNKLDFVLIILSLPSILFLFVKTDIENLSFLLIFRTARVFKFFRFFKFIPNIEHLIQGVRRAIHDSILIMVAFTVYNFIISVFSCYLYKEIAPEFYGDPIRAFYSTFKIFTIEGWYEIPDTIAINSSETVAFFTKMYFIIVMLTGGIIGLSLVNSIFVDAMVSDNNDELEKKVDDLNRKIDELLKLYRDTEKKQ